MNWLDDSPHANAWRELRQLIRDKNLRKEHFCVIATEGDTYLSFSEEGLAKTVQRCQNPQTRPTLNPYEALRIYEYVDGLRYYRGYCVDGQWRPAL